MPVAGVEPVPKNNPQAQDDHGNNRDDLDDGEPELHFSVGADVEEIDGCDDGKQYRR